MNFREIKCMETVIDTEFKYCGRIKGTSFYFMGVKGSKNKWVLLWWEKQGLKKEPRMICFNDIIERADPKLIQELLYYLDIFSKKSFTELVE